MVSHDRWFIDQLKNIEIIDLEKLKK
jgi:ATPase subunit of ABC transporter with duplicated ATPase domains